MNVDFVPTATVAVSLFACMLLPVFLLSLSHGALRVAAPGRRFVLAATLTWAAWLATLTGTSPTLVDVVAGAMLLATATLIGFTLWTLAAWGFTVSMLLALNRADEPLTCEEWAIAYTRGKALNTFARDRLGVLFKLGLATERNGQVMMTPARGRLFAVGAVMLRKLFGLTA
jgi:hypothetical protein